VGAPRSGSSSASHSTPPLGLLPGPRIASWKGAVPHFVACDIDGTLVGGERSPSDRVLAAVRDAVTAGLRVGLATGRMAEAVGPVLARGAFTGPHVFHNGALVQDGAGGVLSLWPLGTEAVDALLKFAQARTDLIVEVYVAGGYLVNRHDPRADGHVGLLGIAPAGRVASSADLVGQRTVKAVVVAFDAHAAADAFDAVSALGLGPGPASSPAAPALHFLNVTATAVDKGRGVLAAAASIGVAADAIAAIGDDRNDAPMLRAVGTAVAMGGAHPEALAAAHFVAPTFADGGAGVALEAITALASGAARRGPDAQPQRPVGTW
jgi:Cof subfamily protein (haloacid dehalogenase superfamily)